MAEKKTFKQWCKDHQTGLILAGTALAGGLLIYAGCKIGNPLAPADHGQNDPYPDPDDDEDEDSIMAFSEDLTEDLYCRRCVNLHNAVIDKNTVSYWDHKSYEMPDGREASVTLMMDKHDAGEDISFNERVNLISQLCPDIETDDIIQFLKDEEEVNAELDAEEAEA